MTVTKTYTPKTGIVTIRNFDQGLIETLGAVNVGGVYYLTLAGIQEGVDIPVIFRQPEQPLTSHRLPAIIITRENFEAANSRWQSVRDFDYFTGVSGTETVIDGVSGYKEVEFKAQSWPWDIPYTIACYARYEYDAQVILLKMMRRFKPYCAIFVTDSLSVVRSYTGFLEGAINDISEVTDVADRVRGFSMTVRVEGEIDLFDPVLADTVTGQQRTVGRI